MWWKTIVMILTIAVLSLDTAQASVTWDIWEDTTITSGTYDRIRIDYENPGPSSIVLMSGGYVNAIEGYNMSVLELFETGTINIFVGEDSSSLYLQDNGIINTGIEMRDSSKAYLRGGTFQPYSYVGAFQSAEIHIYGYDFNLVSDILTGRWESGIPFSIWLRGPDTFPRTYLHEIPEPTTILLMSLGGGLLIKRRFSFCRNFL